MYKSKLGYMVQSRKYAHRQKAELVLGRELTTEERVHHVDNNKANNVNANLVICPNEKYHKLLHARQRIVELGGNPNTEKYCSYHKCLHSRTEFSSNPSMYDDLHNMCRDSSNEYRRLKGISRGKFNWAARLNQQYRRAKRGISWLQKT